MRDLTDADVWQIKRTFRVLAVAVAAAPLITISLIAAMD